MDALIEAAVGILPDSDWAKIVGLSVIGFVILVATGRFKLEWIGQLCRHVARWLRCKILDRHHYRGPGVFIIGGLPSPTTYTCTTCGKTEIRIE